MAVDNPSSDEQQITTTTAIRLRGAETAAGLCPDDGPVSNPVVFELTLFGLVFGILLSGAAIVGFHAFANLRRAGA